MTPAPAWIADRLTDLLEAPVTVGHRLHWVYLLSFVLLAAWVRRRAQTGEGARGPAAFLRWLFPRGTYLHPSAVTDYKLFLANSFVTPAAATAGAVGAAWVAVETATTIDRLVPGVWAGLPWSSGTTVVFTLSLLVLRDFSHFLNHWLQHRVSWLWPLHAVHHSAEVLTPLTLFRKHPLYDLVKKAIEALVVGLFQGALLFAFGNHLELWEIAGVNGFYALFLLAGSNLRHSHVWWDWGALDHVFISPAQHQLHHSIDPAHHGRNFGSVLAIWDGIFGTLLVPEVEMDLRFGLPGGPRHDGLGEAWVRPVVDSAAAIRRAASRRCPGAK